MNSCWVIVLSLLNEMEGWRLLCQLPSSSSLLSTSQLRCVLILFSISNSPFLGWSQWDRCKNAMVSVKLINEKRYSLQSSEWAGGVKSSMLTVKQLQPAISFITEVFEIFNFGIQFLLVANFRVLPVILILLSSRFWTDLSEIGLKKGIISLSNAETRVKVLFAVSRTSWRFVNSQAVPAGCQHHNWGLYSFYIFSGVWFYTLYIICH